LDINGTDEDIHHTTLSLWETPLGERWSLELVEQDQKHSHWNFSVISCPLAIAGGLTSPPNALAASELLYIFRAAGCTQ
jgi:hypothetical protein